MANRPIGTFDFPFSFEVIKQQPLDARLVVPEHADLVNIPLAYVGMVVTVTNDPTSVLNGLYILVDDNSDYPGLVLNNWEIYQSDSTTLSGATVNNITLSLGMSDGTSYDVDMSSDFGDGITGHQFIRLTDSDITPAAPTYTLDFNTQLSRTDNTIVLDMPLADNGINYFIVLPAGSTTHQGCKIKILLKSFQTTVSTKRMFVMSNNNGNTNRILASNLETYVPGSGYYLPLTIMETVDLIWDGVDWLVTNYIKEDYVSPMGDYIEPI